MYKRDSFVEKVIVNISNRKFDLYSEHGEHEVVQCDTQEQFLNCLSAVKYFQSKGDFDKVEYISEFLSY